MEQETQTQPQGRQNRLARELEARTTAHRPAAWRAPDTLPTPDPRPGWAHRSSASPRRGTESSGV